MPRFVFRSLVLLAAAPAMLMVGCGGKEERAKADPANDDPALTGALADQIMVDPDLTGQNEVASGARMVVADGMLPTDNNAPEQAAAARSEAVALAGGPGAMKVLPEAKPTGGGNRRRRRLPPRRGRRHHRPPGPNAPQRSNTPRPGRRGCRRCFRSIRAAMSRKRRARTRTAARCGW